SVRLRDTTTSIAPVPRRRTATGKTRPRRGGRSIHAVSREFQPIVFPPRAAARVASRIRDDPMVKERQRWTHELTGYHWFVFLVASAAWFFDCLDQRLFSLARNPALEQLMAKGGDAQSVGKIVTALFLIG